MSRRVGASYNRGEAIERRVRDAEDAQDRIERAAFAFVRELDALDIVGNGAKRRGHVENVGWRHVDKNRIRIDEATDEPGAGDAIDLRLGARHPFIWRPI